MTRTEGTSPPSSPVEAVTTPEGRRFGARAALGLAALTLGAGPFLLLWGLVQESWRPLAALDGEVAAALNAAVTESPDVVAVLVLLSDLGGTGTAVLVLGLTTAFLLIRRRRRLAAFVVVTGAGLAILVPVTKAVIGRARPVVAAPVVDVPSNASFPSGHAMTSLVTWGVLLLLALPAVDRRLRRWLVVGTTLVVVAVGFTRLALGVHFVSDVVAGWALGSAWLAVTAAAFRGWQHDRGQEHGEPLDPLGLAADSVRPAPSPRPVLPAGRTAVRLAATAGGLFVVLSALGLLVTGALTDTWLGRFDRGVVRHLVAVRSEDRSAVADVLSALAGTRTVLAVGLTLAVLGLAVTRSWRPAVFVAVTLTGEVLLYFTVSQVVGRLRPQVADLTSGLPTGASWPSGHAAAAAALYGALAALLLAHTRDRRRWWAVALPLVLAPGIGVSRIYVAAHYPTDVLAGLALGTVWVVACARALLTAHRNGVPDEARRPDELSPRTDQKEEPCGADDPHAGPGTGGCSPPRPAP
jgi:undecaprenyl-diphosphatase